MAIDIPPHDFASAECPMAASLIVTPELQRWADAAASSLEAAGSYVPADLVLLRNGSALSQLCWLWLVDEVLKPRPACPF